MRILDLNHSIEPHMPRYPGTPGPEFSSLSSIAEGGFAERLYTFSSHTGTHIDLPSHMIERGRSLDDFPIERFYGKGCVVDVRMAAGESISAAFLQRFEGQLRLCEYLLFCSGWSSYWGTARYFEDYPVLSPDAARWLCGFNLKGIGFDMISADAAGDDRYPVHNLLLEKGLIIVENLCSLSDLLSCHFNFCCFPLKISGAEAVPVRAVALVDENGNP
jgi:arylformamidase